MNRRSRTIINEPRGRDRIREGVTSCGRVLPFDADREENTIRKANTTAILLAVVVDDRKLDKGAFWGERQVDGKLFGRWLYQVLGSRNDDVPFRLIPLLHEITGWTFPIDLPTIW